MSWFIRVTRVRPHSPLRPQAPVGPAIPVTPTPLLGPSLEHPDDVILCVGKGITFDSGGLNIKGTGFMEDMHME